MRRGRKQAVRATFTLVGTIIGAGIFGVPYVYARAGVAVGVLETIGIGAMLLLLYLLYAEMQLRTFKPARLPGYARRYLGARWGAVATVSTTLGFWAALLAYLILGGAFLSTLLGGAIPLALPGWQILFYAACAAVVAAGLELVGGAEALLTAILLACAGAILALLAPHMDLTTLPLAVPGRAALPYGVLLFALSGTGAIPTVRDLLRGSERMLPGALIAGAAIATVATILFGLAVAGVTGQGTTEHAIDGLLPIVGAPIVVLGAVFGILAISTSFFTAGLNLLDVFRVDYRLTHARAAALALLPPVLAFVLGAHRFIDVIGFAGALFGAFDASVICLTYLVARRRGRRDPEFSLGAPVWLVAIVIPLFILGFLVHLSGAFR